MHGDLQAHEKGQCAALIARQFADRKHVIRADTHAIFLALAFARIDHRRDDARWLPAGRCIGIGQRAKTYLFNSRIAVSSPPRVSGYMRPDMICWISPMDGVYSQCFSATGLSHTACS